MWGIGIGIGVIDGFRFVRVDVEIDFCLRGCFGYGATAGFVIRSSFSAFLFSELFLLFRLWIFPLPFTEPCSILYSNFSVFSSGRLGLSVLATCRVRYRVLVTVNYFIMIFSYVFGSVSFSVSIWISL